MRLLLISVSFMGLVACNTSFDEVENEKKKFQPVSNNIHKADVTSSIVASYTSYYENELIKCTGPGFEKFFKNMVSLKDGVPLKESPDLNSKSIATIPFDTEVEINLKLNSTQISLDSITEKEVSNLVQEEWVYVKTEFYLNPGDDGYSEDLTEPAQLEGYIQSNSISKQLDSTKKSGVWYSYYKTGQINKEELCLDNRIIKSITYYNSGNIAEIIEYRNDYFWEGSVRKSFHENGNIKTISDAEGGGAVSISFDENGEYEGDWDYSGMKDHFDNIVLSKDIREFFLLENKDIDPNLLYN